MAGYLVSPQLGHLLCPTVDKGDKGDKGCSRTPPAMAAKQDVCTPVSKLSELMEVLSGYEKETTGRCCVTVCDVYCTIWGPCSALKSTFRDISIQDVDDSAVKLRFLQVNATEILAELDSRSSSDPPLSPRSAKRPIELQRDILPDAWKERYKNQLRKAKPLFLFYKDCQFITAIEGVDTPHIKRTIRSLIKERKPASDFITNTDFLEQWNEQLGPEAEQPWPAFWNALCVWCLIPPGSPNLNEEETKLLFEAIQVEKSGGQTTIHAKGVQEWIGDSRIDTSFRELLPGYESRAAEERAKKEAEEKKRAEAEAQQAKEREAEAAKKAEEEAKRKAEEEERARVAAEEKKAEEEAREKAREKALKEAMAKEAEETKYRTPFIHTEDTVGITLGTAAENGMAGSFTVELWVEPAEGVYYEERVNEDLALLGCGTPEQGKYFFISLRSQKLYASILGSEVSGETEVPEGEWTHLAVSYNSEDGETVLYVNGKVEKQGKLEGSIDGGAQVHFCVAEYEEGNKNTAFLGKTQQLKVIPEIVAASDIESSSAKTNLQEPAPPQGESKEVQEEGKKEEEEGGAAQGQEGEKEKGEQEGEEKEGEKGEGG
eukprot:Sspe_Gene.35990::Locus_17431_Transcript_1_1_Confidence_1.000_Length_2542::g.35990::m.35990